eukprot:2906825-Rhodomonas_salina.8
MRCFVFSELVVCCLASGRRCDELLAACLKQARERLGERETCMCVCVCVWFKLGGCSCDRSRLRVTVARGVTVAKGGCRPCRQL